MNAVDLLVGGGIRPTAIRTRLLRLLTVTDRPQTADQLQGRLEKDAHKVTIYRDMELLMKAGIVEKVQFNERAARYQLKSVRHAHHLICDTCGQIDQIELPHDLDREEVRIKRQKRFTVKSHSLEFYGLCRHCQV